MTGDPTATGPAAGAFPSAAPTTPADAERRRLLTYAAGAVGGAGLIATAYPFVDSFEPSAKALAAGGPVEAAWGELQLGQMRTVAWRGKPVWLMRRTPAMVAELDKGIPQLLDPDSKHSQQPAACRNATRSLVPDLFVAVGICTHLGCSPVLKVGDPAFEAEMSGDDGYYCPCHGSRYDLAGRVVRNVPAPLNLVIPPYTLLPGKRVRIG